MGFNNIEKNSNSFSVKIGWSELSFEKSNKEHKYHYRFLISANKLHTALKWMEKRLEILDVENGKKIQNLILGMLILFTSLMQVAK
jgi:hypothetical protein